MVESGSDRRRYPRLDVRMEGAFAPMNIMGGPNKPIKAVIRNISGTGAFVETEKPLHEGALLEMDFKLIENNNPVHAEAVVRWIGVHENCSAGMGVEFIGMN